MVRFIIKSVDENGKTHISTASYNFSTGEYDCAMMYFMK